MQTKSLTLQAFIGLVVVGVLFAPACGSDSTETSALTRVDIVYPAISPASYPLWVAKEIGAFERYGVDANLIFVEGGQRAAASVVSGSAPFALVAGPNILDPAAEGADIVAVMSMGNRLTDVIVGGTGVERPEDLRGGALAANEPGGETDLVSRYALEQMGLVPDEDVRVIAVGGESTRVAALTSGNVQATIMDVSLTTEMQDQGFATLYSFLESDLPYQKNALATSRSYWDANPAVVESVVKAMLEGVAYYKNHRDEAISIAAQYSASTDLESIGLSYDIYEPATPYVPKLTADGFITIQGWSQDEDLKALDPTTVFDNSLLEELEESGFTERVEASGGE